MKTKAAFLPRRPLSILVAFVLLGACVGHDGARNPDVVVARRALVDPSTILVDTGTDVGATGGSFSVGLDGSANYVIPLWTPESVSKATQPQLALRYSSAAGEGLVAFGWDVVGFSRITRCASGRGRLTQGPRKLSFENSDGLCLDGLRMVYLAHESAGAPAGSTGAVYHTEPDRLARITVVGHDLLGPTGFEVRGADGRIHSYGVAVEAMRQTTGADPNSATSPVFTTFVRARSSWLLERTEDRFGNRMNISWSTRPVADAEAQEAVPVTIDYGGQSEDVLRRQVVFHYVTRPAEASRRLFQSGFPWQRQLRLQSIEMRAPNPVATDTVRWYELGYGALSVTQRQLLRSLQECDGPPGRAGRSCKQPTTFSYEGGLDTFQRITTSITDIRVSGSANEKFWRLLVADLNNDGRDDVLYRNGRDWKYSLSRCAGNLTGCGFNAGTTLNIASTLRGGSTARPYDPVIADLDRDGIPDLAGINPNTPNRYLFYRGTLGTGTSVSFALDRTEPAGAESTPALWVMTPLGKGQPGIFRPLDGGTWGQWSPYFQQYLPVAFQGDEPVSWNDSDPTQAWNSYAADIDGDGGPDLLGSANLHGQSGLKRLVAGAQAFQSGELTTLPISEPTGVTRKYLFADLNGDGLPEAVQLASGTNGPRVAENTGNGFKEASLQALPSDANIRMASDARWGHLTDPGVRVLDYDGDGRQDLLLVDDGRVRGPASSSATRSRLKVLLSRNAGFVKQDVPIDIGQPANGGDTLPSGGASNWLLTQVLDANGDGLSDIALVRNGVLELQIRQGKARDMLTGIRDGMGVKRAVVYDPLSNTTRHTPPDQGFCVYPQGCPENGQWLVARHLVDNGNGTAQNETSYQYAGYTVDHESGTTLGFTKVTETRPSHVAGQTHVVEYKFDYALRSDIEIDGHLVRVYRSHGRPTEITETVQLGGGRAVKTVTRTDSELFSSQQGRTYYVHDTRTTITETNEANQARTVTIHTPLQQQDLDFGTVRSVRKEIFDHTTSTTIQTDVWNKDFYHPQNGADRRAWLIGLPRSLEWSSSTPDYPDRTRRLDFEINNMDRLEWSNGAIENIYVERYSGDVDLYLHTNYQYDGRGQVWSVTQQDLDPATPDRTTTITYDSLEHLHPEFIHNGLHETRFVTHPGLGVVGEVIDPNGLSTVLRYDRFGRPRAALPDGGDGVTWGYTRTLASGSPPASDPAARFTTTVTETHQTGAFGRIVRDGLNREIRRERRLMDGTMASQQTAYHNIGWLKSTSRPVTGTGTGPLTTYSYDNLGRTTEVKQADETDSGRRQTVITYDGRQTTVTEGVKTTTYLADAADRVLTSTAGITTRYEYGPFGLLMSVRRAPGGGASPHVSWMDYDNLGRRIYLQDPDAKGRSTFYNAFGDVRATQTDDAYAEYYYDQVGRQTGRNTKDGYRGIGWDSAPGAGIGRVHYTYAETTADDWVMKTYAYDGLGRTTHSELQRARPDGSSAVHTVELSHDEFGRPSHIRYPYYAGTSRIEVRNDFDPDSGELGRVIDTRPGGTTYWQLQATGADGQITRELHGNGVQTTRTYYASSGRLKSVVGATSSTLQNLAYKYNNGDGNLRVRSNNVTGQHERFEYDSLDRIRRWVRATDASGAEMSGGWKVNYTIDNLGNLRRRESIAGSGGGATQNATFEYDQWGNAGPHAITSTSLHPGEVYDYDFEGNQVGRPGGETISYTAEDLPKTITGPRAASFAYDALGVRVEKRDDLTGELTTYVDGLFEVRSGGTVTDHVHHIQGPEGVVAQVTVPTNNGTVGAQRTRYVHPDHLGSTELVTCGTGESSATCPTFVAERRSYDPFGNNLTGTSNKHLPTLQADPVPASKVAHGFTGHEMDFRQGLINMRGREYDPRIGRFLTPDPIVQAPLNGQSYNRYAYVFNNPTKYVDPSGFMTNGISTVCPEGTDDYWCVEELKKCQEAGGCMLDLAVVADLEAQGCQVHVNGFGYVVVPGTCGNTGGGGGPGGTDPPSQPTGTVDPSECPQGTSPTTGSNGAQWCEPTKPPPPPLPGRLGGAGGGGSGGMGFWDKTQLALDLFSVGADLTGVGAAISWVPDLLNAGISLARGDFKGAALSAGGAIPGIGNVFNAARLARGAGRVIDPGTLTRFEVTPSGVAIPKNPDELRSNLSNLSEVSTNPGSSRKFVGVDSQGPVRVRVEKAHPSDPNFTGTPDPLHTVDHLHIDRRANGQTGSWGSEEKVPYDWPF